MEKDKALFIGFYFWCGYHKQSLWEEFDKVYTLADKFVQTYAQDKKWGEESFEEYMDKFIREHIAKQYMYTKVYMTHSTNNIKQYYVKNYYRIQSNNYKVR